MKFIQFFIFSATLAIISSSLLMASENNVKNNNLISVPSPSSSSSSSFLSTIFNYNDDEELGATSSGSSGSGNSGASDNGGGNIPLGQSHSFPVANAYLTQSEVSDLWYEFFWNDYFINVTQATTAAWKHFDAWWNVALYEPCPVQQTAGSQVFEFTAHSERPVLGDLEIRNKTFNITVLPGGILQVTGLIDWKATTDTTAFGVQGNCPVGNGDCSCQTGDVDFLCCGTPDVNERNCLKGVEVSIHAVYNASLLLLLQPTSTGYVNILPTSTATVVYSEIVYPCQSIENPSSLQNWLFSSNVTFFNKLTSSLLQGQEWIRESIQQMQLDFVQVTLRASMARQITQQYKTPSGMWVSYFVTRFWSEYENFITVFVNGSFSFVSSTSGWQEFFNASYCDSTQENPPSVYPYDIKTAIRVSSAALQAMVWAAYIDGTFHMFNHHKVIDADVLLRMFITEPLTSVPEEKILHMYIAGGSSVASCVSEIDHRNKTLVQASFANVGVRGGILLRTMLPLTVFGKVHNFEFDHATFTIEKPTGGFPRQTLQRIIEKGLNESIPFVNWGLKRNGFNMPSVTQYLMSPAEANLDLIYRPDITCAPQDAAQQGYFELSKFFAGEQTPAPTPPPTPPTYPANARLFKMVVSLFSRDPNHNSTVRRGTACDPTVTGNQMTNVAVVVDEKYFAAAETGHPVDSPCEHLLQGSQADYYYRLHGVTIRKMISGNSIPGINQPNGNLYRYYPSKVLLLCTSSTCEPSSCLYNDVIPRPDECIWLDTAHNITNMSEPLSFNFGSSTLEFDAMSLGVVPDGIEGNNGFAPMENPYALPDMLCSPATVASSAQWRQPEDVALRVLFADPSCGLAQNAYWGSTVAVQAPLGSSSAPAAPFAVTFFNPPRGQQASNIIYVGVDNRDNMYYCDSPIPKVSSMMPLVCVVPPINLPETASSGSDNPPACNAVPGMAIFPNSTLSTYFFTPNQLQQKICMSDWADPNANNRYNSDIVIPDEDLVSWPVLVGGLLILLVLGLALAVLRTYLRRVRQRRLVEEMRRRRKLMIEKKKNDSNINQIKKKRQEKQKQQQQAQNNNNTNTNNNSNYLSDSKNTSFAKASRNQNTSNNQFSPKNGNDINNNNDEEVVSSNKIAGEEETEDSNLFYSKANIIESQNDFARNKNNNNKNNSSSEEDDFDDEDEDESFAAYNSRRLKYLHNQPGEVWTQAEKIHSLSCLIAALAFIVLGLAWEDPFQRISMDSARGLGIPDLVDISPMADYFKWWSFSLLRSTVLICAAALLVLGVLPFAGPLSVDFHEEQKDEEQQQHQKSSKTVVEMNNNGKQESNLSNSNNQDEDFDEITETEISRVKRSYPAFGDESFWRHCRSHAMFASITVILLVLIVPLFTAPIRNGTYVESLGSKNSLIGGKETHDEIMLLSSLATTLVAAPIVLNLICMFLTAIPVGTLLGLILHDFFYGESEALTPAAAVATITMIVEKPRPINNVVAHSVFVQLIISILLPLVVLIFVFCMFQSTQSSETWLYVWGVYCLLVVSTSAILLMRVLFRTGPATAVLVVLCVVDFVLISVINHMSQDFLGDVTSTTFSLFHICLVVVDAIGIMEAPHEGSKKARWYHRIADLLFRYVVYPTIWGWFLMTKCVRNVCCGSGLKRRRVDENGNEIEELTISQQISRWVESKKLDLLVWEHQYFKRLANEEKARQRKQNGEADESDFDQTNESMTDNNNKNKPKTANDTSSGLYGGTGNVDDDDNQNHQQIDSRHKNGNDDDESSSLLQNNNNQNNHKKSSSSSETNIQMNAATRSSNLQNGNTSFAQLTEERKRMISADEERKRISSSSNAHASSDGILSPGVHYSAATAFLRFCRDYLFMAETGATAETAPVFGFRPWWRRLAGLICVGCFAYIVYNDEGSVNETVRSQLIHALNSTLDFPSNISKIHLSVDPGLAVYQTAIDQQFTYTWVTLVFIALGAFADWFFPTKNGLYASKVLFGLGFVVMLTSLLIIATPNYVKECGLASNVPYCAPKFYRDGVWILTTTSGLFFALLVLSQLAPVLIALSPTLARLLWLVAAATSIFDTRWLLLQIAIFTPVTVFLPLLAASQVTNFAPVVTVGYLLLFLPIAIAGVAYGFKIRSVAFVSVSLIWVGTFIGLWIDLGVRMEEWNPWFIKYLVELLSHAKFYCELLAELCLTAVCTSDLILHILRNQVSGDTHSIPPRQQQFLSFVPVLNQLLNVEQDVLLTKDAQGYEKVHNHQNSNNDEQQQHEELEDPDDESIPSFFDKERCFVMIRHLLPKDERIRLRKRQQELAQKNTSTTTTNNIHNNNDNSLKINNSAELLDYLDQQDQDGKKVGYWNAAAILSPEFIAHKRHLMKLKMTTTSEISLHVSPFVVDCLVDSVRGRIFAGVLKDGLLRREIFGGGKEGEPLQREDGDDVAQGTSMTDDHDHDHENKNKNTDFEQEEEENILFNFSTNNSDSLDEATLLKQVQDRVLVMDATNWKFFCENEDKIDWEKFHLGDEETDEIREEKQQRGVANAPRKATSRKWKVIIGVLCYAQHHFVSFKYEVRSHRLVVCESNHDFLARNSASFMKSLARLIGTEAAPGGILRKILIPPSANTVTLNPNEEHHHHQSTFNSRTLGKWIAPPPTFFLAVPQHPIEESAYGCVNDMALLSGRETRGNITHQKIRLLCETLLEEQESEVDPLTDDTWARNACRLL